MFFKVWELSEGPRKAFGKRLDLQVGLLDRLWTAKMASWRLWVFKLGSRGRFGPPSELLWVSKLWESTWPRKPNQIRAEVFPYVTAPPYD